MRRLILLIALLLVIAPASALAQITVTTDPGVNVAGLAKTTITIPSGQALRIAMATPTITSATKDDTSGSLLAGVYKVTVVSSDPSDTGVTLYPTALSATCAGGTSHIDVVYVAPAGAKNTRVYVSDAGGATPDRYFVSTSATAYAFTTVAGATVAALPTTATAYYTAIGATSGWLGGARFEFSNSSAVANLNIGHTTPTIYTTGNNNLGIGLNALYRATTAIGNLGIGHSALSSQVDGQNNVAVGWDSQMFNVSGQSNTSVGLDALKAVTGSYNTAVGDAAALSTTTGTYNVAVGVNALRVNVDGGYNLAVGHSAMELGTSADQNVALGDGALYTVATGGYNTAVGVRAGFSAPTTASRNVFLGYRAGYYETGSDKLFIDNANRASEADGRAKALVYGIFAAATADQQLTVNGSLNVAQGTPATAIPTLSLTSTWNDAGVTHLGYKHVITNTASASGSLPFQILGGTAGATNLFKVDTFGVVTIGGSLVTSNSGSVTAGVTGYLALRSRIYSSADAAFELTNGAKTGYTTLSLGPLTGNTVNGTLSISQVTTVINMASATGTGTGTITSPTTAIPIGLILGVSCRVTPILAGALLTTFSLGNGTDADMFGTTLAIAADTLVNVNNYTITAPWYNTAAKSLVLTAAAGVFSTGILTCTTHYISLVPVGS